MPRRASAPRPEECGQTRVEGWSNERGGVEPWSREGGQEVPRYTQYWSNIGQISVKYRSNQIHWSNMGQISRSPGRGADGRGRGGGSRERGRMKTAAWQWANGKGRMAMGKWKWSNENGRMEMVKWQWSNEEGRAARKGLWSNGHNGQTAILVKGPHRSVVKITVERRGRGGRLPPREGPRYTH